MKKALMMCFMLVIAFMMVGCSNDNDNTILYNAVMVNSGSIDTAQTVNYFKKDFLLENKVSGVRYKNENYDPTNPESEEYIFDESSPETITYVLDSLDKYESSENNLQNLPVRFPYYGSILPAETVCFRHFSDNPLSPAVADTSGCKDPNCHNHR